MSKIICVFFLLMFPVFVQAQYLDEFKGDKINGWFFFTGDGNSTMDFIQKEEYARILIDATKDKHNVWWGIIKNDVTPYLHLSKLQHPDFELRIEAKIRASKAPRRVNFMINTQRTTDYHEHLREYDIPDTENWHVISMTTKNLDAVTGDTLFVQLGVTDWGFDQYYVDIDYYRADIVNVKKVGPDKGEPLVYHPPVPDISTFSHKINVAHDAIINPDYPDVNFADWSIKEQENSIPVLTVTRNHWPILRWNFDDFREKKADGAAILELTTHSFYNGGDYIGSNGEELGEEFGKIRIIEIFGGDSKWGQGVVTYNSLFGEGDPREVINGQMIFDAEVAEVKEGRTYITIPRPVFQRLLDGQTKGLIVKPLGAISASFYASEAADHKGPVLYFNTKQ